MKNDLENEVPVNEKKIKSYHGIKLTTYSIKPEQLTHWAIWPVGVSGVKLQYKLAQTRPVNIARMHDDSTSVIGRYDILHFCR